VPNVHPVRVAGNVIVRQRPGTAKGIVFLSLEDETGIANVVVMPDVFDRQRAAILSYAWVMVEGEMQNVDRVVHVRARHVAPLTSPLAIGTASHDFR
jgi:error-prone DNA polymerase